MLSLLFRTLPAASLALSVGAANAAYMDCSDDLSGLVSNTTACQISTATQDYLNTDPLTVNEEGGFFGIDSWQFIDKDELADNAGQSGNWNLDSGIWELFDEIMLVFKSGNERSGVTLVAYLAEEPATSGTWESPFRMPDFGIEGIKDVSHISYYGSGNGEVPEPSALLLMSAGLLVVGALRRKRCG